MFYPHLHKLELSHSSRMLFRSCNRKLEMRKFFQHPGKDESIAGSVGNCLHTGYQHYLVHKDRDKAIAAMMLDYPIHLNSNPTHTRSLEACYYTLQSMLDTDILMEFELANIVCLDGVTRPAVEVQFEITINGFQFGHFMDGPYGKGLKVRKPIPIIYNGFIDIIAFNHLTGEYLIIDIKTHRDSSNDLTTAYQQSEQCIPYAIVLERILNKPLDGFTIKYMSVYIDIETPKISIYSFEKTKEDIKDWARGLLVDLRQLKLFYELGWFPKNGENCRSWKKTCKFFDICSSSRNIKHIQKYLLQDKRPYETRVRDPWIKLNLELAA